MLSEALGPRIWTYELGGGVGTLFSSLYSVSDIFFSSVFWLAFFEVPIFKWCNFWTDSLISTDFHYPTISFSYIYQEILSLSFLPYFCFFLLIMSAVSTFIHSLILRCTIFSFYFSCLICVSLKLLWFCLFFKSRVFLSNASWSLIMNSSLRMNHWGAC